MKKKIIGLVLCIIVFVYFVGGIIYSFSDRNNNNVKETKKKSSLTIKGFDYLLYEDDLNIYKSEFKKLKTILESKEIDYLEYAYSISKMFIIDLYSLDNKDNKYDVGGLEFVYPEARENYKLNVENTLYKYIKDNTSGDRKQELPVVKNVEIVSDDIVDFTIGEKKYDAYKINVSIEYEKDLKYDDKAELIIVKEDKYLYIVEKN